MRAENKKERRKMKIDEQLLEVLMKHNTKKDLGRMVLRLMREKREMRK